LVALPKDITTELQVISDDRISRGPYADLWVGVWNGRTKTLIKVLHVLQDPNAQQKARAKLVQALTDWHKLTHKNVMRLYGTCNVIGSHIALVLPFYENGSLIVYLTDKDTRDKVDKVKLLEGVASGLECLHNGGVIHGDLRSSTIMVDAAGDPVLANFGQRQIVLETAGIAASAADGCARWMAPEILSGEYVTYKSDIYSFASVCLEIVVQIIPYFYVDDDNDVVNYVLQYRLPTHPYVELATFREDNPLWDLMQLCWDKQPNNRPTAGDVVKVVQKLKVAVEDALASQFLNMNLSTSVPKADPNDS
jgi:serine/threonine protein kinase